MWSTFESLTGMAAEEPTQDGEQEAAPAEAPVEPAAEGTDLMTSLWGGLSAVAEGVQSQIEYQQKALDDEMAKGKGVTLDGGALPWDGCDPDVAAQILALSEDERPFLQPAPAESKFSFNLEDHAAISVAVCEADPRLAELRYTIVPDRVSDKHFWKNYFFRVKLIKEMPSLLTNSAAPEQQEQHQESKPATKSTDEPEFASDDYKSTDVETDAWRKELQEELGLGLEDDDDLDMDDEDWEADLSSELLE